MNVLEASASSAFSPARFASRSRANRTGVGHSLRRLTPAQAEICDLIGRHADNRTPAKKGNAMIRSVDRLRDIYHP